MKWRQEEDKKKERKKKLEANSYSVPLRGEPDRVFFSPLAKIYITIGHEKKEGHLKKEKTTTKKKKKEKKKGAVPDKYSQDDSVLGMGGIFGVETSN